MSAFCEHCGAVAGWGRELGHKSNCPTLAPHRHDFSHRLPDGAGGYTEFCRVCGAVGETRVPAQPALDGVAQELRDLYHVEFDKLGQMQKDRADPLSCNWQGGRVNGLGDARMILQRFAEGERSDEGHTALREAARAALAAQPPAAPVETQGTGMAEWQKATNERMAAPVEGKAYTCGAGCRAACNWPVCNCDPKANEIKQELIDHGWTPDTPVPPFSAGTTEAALRDSFPHFQDGSPITPEAIRGIGKEYLDMVMSWEPHKDEIEFSDHNGTIRKIVYEPGDYEVGINPGWVLEDDTLDQPQSSSMEDVRQLVEIAIRTFCQSLGAGAVTISSGGVERIYHAGINLKALSVAVAMAVTRPHSQTGEA